MQALPYPRMQRGISCGAVCLVLLVINRATEPGSGGAVESPDSHVRPHARHRKGAWMSLFLWPQAGRRATTALGYFDWRSMRRGCPSINCRGRVMLAPRLANSNSSGGCRLGCPSKAGELVCTLDATAAAAQRACAGPHSAPATNKPRAVDHRLVGAGGLLLGCLDGLDRPY
jgi:hypothetical protein